MAQPGAYSMNKPVGMLGYGKADIVQPLLDSVGGRMATADEIKANLTLPMAVAGITKRIIPNHARQQGLDWYCIDTGYFGNRSSHKNWFRVTRNEYQNSQPVKPRSGQRLSALKLDRTQYPRGSRIVVVPAHPKVCEAWQLGNADAWLANTVTMIKQHTDRPIVVRDRPASRHVRQTENVFTDFIRNDVHAVISWTSNCLVESAMHGIPVISLGPSAALQISGRLESIDNLPDLDRDQVEAWMRHLSHGQFTLAEMRSGAWWNIFNG